MAKRKPTRSSKPQGNLHVQQQKFHQGPIPAPEDLEKYNSVVPDAAERIIVMAEEESKHRRNLEQLSLEYNLKDRESARVEIKLGQILSFLLCAMVIGSGTYIAVTVHVWAGILLSGVGISGIISAYLRK